MRKNGRCSTQRRSAGTSALRSHAATCCWDAAGRQKTGSDAKAPRVVEAARGRLPTSSNLAQRSSVDRAAGGALCTPWGSGAVASAVECARLGSPIRSRSKSARVRAKSAGVCNGIACEDRSWKPRSWSANDQWARIRRQGLLIWPVGGILRWWPRAWSAADQRAQEAACEAATSSTIPGVSGGWVARRRLPAGTKAQAWDC